MICWVSGNICLWSVGRHAERVLEPSVCVKVLCLYQWDPLPLLRHEYLRFTVSTAVRFLLQDYMTLPLGSWEARFTSQASDLSRSYQVARCAKLRYRRRAARIRSLYAPLPCLGKRSRPLSTWHPHLECEACPAVWRRRSRAWKSTVMYAIVTVHSLFESSSRPAQAVQSHARA